MFHVVVEGRVLRLLDSQRERFAFACDNASVAQGHYRLPMLERFAPRTHHFGPGRVFIDHLSQRYVDDLVLSEKAVLRFEHRLKFDRLPALSTPQPAADLSLHGGGESIFRPVAVGHRQPLTPSERGIRLHNDDLEHLLHFLELRLRIGQLIVLSVLPEPLESA